uniref:Rx N-terminal domain-containing protein n=1 Tax=Leersia perrieri TaxID=77586 RepID=A0A0D9XTZ8_9ORYZ
MDLVVGASNNAVKSLVTKLGSLLAQEYTLISGVRDDIQYITDELASMQAFLNKVKRDTDNDEQRKDWMKQVREVAYDIEDCVDDVGHHLGGEPRGSGGLVSLRRAWCLFTTLYARRCIAAEIGNLKLRAQHKFHLSTVLRSLVRQFHEKQAGASQDALHGIEELGDEALKKKLADQLKGKKVKPVAVKEVNSMNPYKLFRQIITCVPADPSEIAMTVLNKCGGLPLVIIVVAGLVASKLKSDTDPEVDSHLHQVNKKLSNDLGNNLTTEGVTHILNHCYNQLRPDLKTCLLYLSMFPKGCAISRKSLIRKWIAEGFISEKHGKPIEEVAQDCFNELIGRNLIRPINNSSNGKVKSCQIHDMVLECIVSKSSNENFITVVGGHWQTPFPSYKVRRLSVKKSDQQEKETIERMKLSHVRSLTAMRSLKALHSTLHKFQILQVSDLEGCKDLSHSKQLKKICYMHQLKYLSLRGTDIHELPKKIGRLEYLEVLDIRDTKIITLPVSILYNQQWRGWRQHGFARYPQVRPLAALEKLTKLKKFAIYRLEKFQGEDNDLLLSVIEHLSSCSLKFLAIDDSFTGFLDSSLSSSQAPPEHLYTLELSGMLSKLPGWIERLHNLEKLTLSLTSLTTDTMSVLGRLPQLFSLTFSLDAARSGSNALKTVSNALKIVSKNTLESGGKIFELNGGFEKLKLLRFIAPVLPPLSFLEGAMPKLQRLELRFRMVECLYGLENLAQLQQIFLTVSSQAPEDAKAKISQIKGLASMIQKAKGSSNPSVVTDEYNELSKEQ